VKSSAQAVLDELRTLGATVIRRGDDVAVRPGLHPIPIDLIVRARTVKADLRALLADEQAPRLGIACCVCRKPIISSVDTWWGGLPCHHACGLTAWRTVWKPEFNSEEPIH